MVGSRGARLRLHPHARGRRRRHWCTQASRTQPPRQRHASTRGGAAVAPSVSPARSVQACMPAHVPLVDVSSAARTPCSCTRGAEAASCASVWFGGSGARGGGAWRRRASRSWADHRDDWACDGAESAGCGPSARLAAGRFTTHGSTVAAGIGIVVSSSVRALLSLWCSRSFGGKQSFSFRSPVRPAGSPSCIRRQEPALCCPVAKGGVRSSQR